MIFAVFTHVTNFYLAPWAPSELDDNYDALKATYDAKVELQNKIVAVATSKTADSDALLRGYVREALRLDPVIDGVYRKATVDGTLGTSANATKFTKGTRLYFDFRAAGLDPAAFKNPSDIDPNRDASLYKWFHGDGVFKVLGEEFVYGAAASVLSTIFSLKNVRRTKGPAGTLRRFKDVVVAPLPTVDYDVVSDASGSSNKYRWVAGEGDTAWRWAYLNPEDAHRVTPWATGLTVTVRISRLNWLILVIY